MKDKFIKSEAILKNIFDDQEYFKKSDLAVVKDVLDLFEDCVKQEVFLSVVASSEGKNKLLSEIDGLIGTYRREIELIKGKSISYQLNEGDKVINMLNKYIELLTGVKDSILNDDFVSIIKPFNIESRMEELKRRLIDKLLESGIASSFIDDSQLHDTLSVNYDKIDRLFDLISSDELMSQIGDIIPVAKKRVKAGLRLASDESRLHAATSLKEKSDDVVVYLAKTNLSLKQDKHIEELIDQLGDARRVLNELLSETRLFQTVCKKEIDQQREFVKGIRFRKNVARDILNRLQSDIRSMDMEFSNLGIDGLVSKLVEGRKVSCEITVPDFLKNNNRPAFTFVDEYNRALVIRRDINNTYDAQVERYNDSERSYNEVVRDYDGAYDSLSASAKEFVKDDIEGMIEIHKFLKDVVDSHYDILIALFSLKLINDGSLLTYNELVEIFSDENTVLDLKSYYELLMERYLFGKNQEVTDIQDSYMLECQSYTTYAKHL